MKQVKILLTNEVIKKDGVVTPMSIGNLMCTNSKGEVVSKQVYASGKNSSVASLKALIEALKLIKGVCSIEVITDVPYIIKVINKIDTWSSKGFKLNDGSQASNLALLLSFISQKSKPQIQNRICVKQYNKDSFVFEPYKKLLTKKLKNVA